MGKVSQLAECHILTKESKGYRDNPAQAYPLSALPSQTSSQLYILLAVPSRMPNSANNCPLILHCWDDMAFQSGDLLHFVHYAPLLYSIHVI